MAQRFTVLIADFLDEASVEAPILDDIARIVAGARDEEELTEDHLRDADAMILFHDIPHLGEATFARAPRLKGVVRAGVGYNNVDLAAAGPARDRRLQRPRLRHRGGGRPRDHAPPGGGAPAAPVRRGDPRGGLGLSDGASTRPGSAARRSASSAAGGSAPRRRSGPRRSAWTSSSTTPRPPGVDKALGIRRAHRLEELLEQSHFVSLHCYLNPTTHHLIDAEALARMRRGAILVNTARGPVVDQDALLEALDSGHLLGAGLDVVEREPLDDERLRHHPRVLLTPHSAFYSVEGFVELRTKAAEEVRRLLLGEPPRNPVAGGPNRASSGPAVSDSENNFEIRANNFPGYDVSVRTTPGDSHKVAGPVRMEDRRCRPV